MNNRFSNNNIQFPIFSIMRGRPHAVAFVKGSESHPEISGVVRFYQTNAGVIVYAEIRGLPKAKSKCHSRIFGFHIHEGTACSGNMNDPFSTAMAHYNPDGCNHPYHAGDLPPLFGNDGFALSIFLTNRFSIDKVIGKTIIIHDSPDDFTTQPSGNSGTKIACGIINRITRLG